MQLIESDDQKFVIKAQIDQFTVSQEKNQITINGLDYNNEIGNPRLPCKVVLLKIPAYANFAVTVLQQESEYLEGVDLAPNPTPRITGHPHDDIKRTVYEPKKNSEVYQSDAFFPEKLVELNYMGFMRNHYLLRVRISLVQYNPMTKKVKINKQIKFELNKINSNNQAFEDMRMAPYRDESSEVFDQIIANSVLNYSEDRVNTWMPKFVTSRQDTEGIFSAVKFYQKIAYLDKCKITVNQNGLYKLMYRELTAAGLNMSIINPTTIHIFNRGQEIPIYVHGEEDGQFNNTDYILFYGEANKTIFTNNNIYWLVIDENGGARVGVKDGTTHNLQSTPVVFYENLHFERDLHYETRLNVMSESDRWMWEEIKPLKEKEITFYLPCMAIESLERNVKFKVLLYGSRNNTDHRVQMSLNDYQVADTTWQYDIDKEILLTLNIPQSYLRDGNNVMQIKSLSQEDFDYIYLDWFEVKYWRKLEAFQDKLDFKVTESGRYSFEINNFSSDSLLVWEIMNPSQQYKIINTSITRENSSYLLNYSAEVKQTANFICWEAEQILKPASISADVLSNLSFTNQQSDYIIITHENFYEESLSLANIHREDGLTVEVVNIQDIYDEFNYGIFNPKAIKNFLEYTYHSWQSPPPTYVILVGDASYDYKDNLGLGYGNYIPTYLTDKAFSNDAAWDDWFVCVRGDDILPDMLIGRLPVRTASEIQSIIEKIHYYKNDFTHREWKKNILLVADNDEKEEKFVRVSNDLLEYIPAEFQINKIYLSDYTNGQKVTEAIIESLNNGCVIVNYTGHGGVDLWAHERIFKIEHIKHLMNRKKLPFVSMFGCDSGAFHHAEVKSIAEALVTTESNGAIATWASSANTYFGYYNSLGESLFSSIFSRVHLSFGAITTQAKLTLLRVDWFILDAMANPFNLLGDPALKLNIVNPEAPVVDLQVDGHPLIAERQYVTRNPLFVATVNTVHPFDTKSIKITLDNESFGIENSIVDYFNHGSNSAEIRIQTDFEQGTHELRVLVADTAGLKGEDRISFTIQKDEVRILNVMNYPNPFSQRTDFTYELSQPADVTIKIYTIAGKLIQIIEDYSMQPFNIIEWDGRDRDGDRIANGVYLYKVIAKTPDKTVSVIERIAKIE